MQRARNKSMVPADLVDMLTDLDKRSERIQSERRILVQKLIRSNQSLIKKRPKEDVDSLVSYRTKENFKL